MISSNMINMPVAAKDKRAFRAFWLPPSFSWVQFTDINIITYMGAHKPRGVSTKNLDEVKRDPEAYMPKIGMTILTDNGTESLPVTVYKTSTLVAGINLLDATIGVNARPIIDRS